MTKRAILLQALASTPSDVERLVRGLEDVPTAWRPDNTVWSPGEIVDHLLAVEQIYLQQIRRLLREEEPLLPPLHPPNERRYASVGLPVAAARFRQARAMTLTTLQDLPPGAWQRAGIHEAKGRITLRFIVQSLVEHDIEHTNQLVEIRPAWRAGQPAGDPVSVVDPGQSP